MSGASSNARQGRALVVENIGAALVSLDSAIYRDGDEGTRLLSFTVSTPWKDRADYLCVCRYDVDGARMVSFTSGATVYECLKATADRIVNRSMVLKEDSYE